MLFAKGKMNDTVLCTQQTQVCATEIAFGCTSDRLVRRNRFRDKSQRVASEKSESNSLKKTKTSNQ